MPGTYLNYWPVTFTAYWAQYQLWGLAPAGYHLVNIGLHAVSAILLWRILTLMRLPGAWLAAALFALHPVNVQSVAWITQLKNTLALMLTLLSVLLYLLSEGKGGRAPLVRGDLQAVPANGSYPLFSGRLLLAASVVLFALATLAKGLTLTLPAVLLACAWWERGRVQKRDLWRVLPYLLIGVAMAGVEVWRQHHLAAGQPVVRRQLPRPDGRRRLRVWFYLESFLWPVDLVFVYPRWNLDPVGLLRFLPGLALAAIFALAWWWRRGWGRPVLMVLVCYVALLLPALGFVDILFMQYSLVADHWQYAALIVPSAALAAAAAAVWRTRPWCRPLGLLLGPVLLGTLALLTCRQSQMYANVAQLYQETIRRNPGCWLAHHNLGVVLAGSGWPDEAIKHYEAALKLKPDYAVAHVNLGGLLADRGRLDEAIGHYRRAIAIKSDYADAYNNLGTALGRGGRFDEAIGYFRQAVAIAPSDAEAHFNLGAALARVRQTDEAARHFQRALVLATQQHKTALAAQLTALLRHDAAGPRRSP